MKQKLPITLAFALSFFCNLGMHAQTPDYVITVNGSILEQRITIIGLYNPYGTNYYVYQNIIRLVVEEKDGTQTYIDLHPLQFEILFGSDIIDGIDNMKMLDGGTIQNKLSLGGLPEGIPVMIFNTGGHLCLSIKTTGSDTPINISTLSPGIYIAKAGNTVFKFVKR